MNSQLYYCALGMLRNDWLPTDKLHPSSTKLYVYPEVLAYVYVYTYIKNMSVSMKYLMFHALLFNLLYWFHSGNEQ